jgi:hypothetical protein
MTRRWLLLPFVSTLLLAQRITTPKDAFGFNIGDDYRLASYSQLESYWKKLAGESDRIKLVDIGATAEGRHQWMAIISSPANLKSLARYREISQRLAHAEPSDAQAQALAGAGARGPIGGLDRWRAARH